MVDPTDSGQPSGSESDSTIRSTSPQSQEQRVTVESGARWKVVGRAVLSLARTGILPSNTLRKRRRRMKLQSNNKTESDTTMLDVKDIDALFLDACCGAVDGVRGPIKTYFIAGGNPSRELTAKEVERLGRPLDFATGETLAHLALKFERETTLDYVLNNLDNHPVSKRRNAPPLAVPGKALEIRKFALSLDKGNCNGSCGIQCSVQLSTYTIPSEIFRLTANVQRTLLNELQDASAQQELEDEKIINWSVELTDTLHSRLYALWNRAAGDCLLDSVFQTTWGVLDQDADLRLRLSECLTEFTALFYERWRESELRLASELRITMDEPQFQDDFMKLLTLAGKKGASLEHLHIYALAHLIRRPIIVYSVKYVRSYQGDGDLGLARYQGIYLPFFCEQSECSKCPIALAYTRGHFSALVPAEPDCNQVKPVSPTKQLDPDDDANCGTIYLPLVTHDGETFPIHFLSESQIGDENVIMTEWLDITFTDKGTMVARQCIPERPELVAQMMNLWVQPYNRNNGKQGSGVKESATSPPPR